MELYIKVINIYYVFVCKNIYVLSLPFCILALFLASRGGWALLLDVTINVPANQAEKRTDVTKTHSHTTYTQVTRILHANLIAYNTLMLLIVLRALIKTRDAQSYFLFDSNFRIYLTP